MIMKYEVFTDNFSLIARVLAINGNHLTNQHHHSLNLVSIAITYREILQKTIENKPLEDFSWNLDLTVQP